MNIPISWLNAITQVEDTTEVFAEKITNTGLAVESINQPNADLTGIVVGRIKTLTRHPDADRLWVTQTDIGTDILQICTAADNLKEGDYVPVAVHGANLAGGLKIKKTKMRGMESNGMLVSVEELGYTRDDYPEAPEDGIYVFQTPLPLGEDAKPYLGLSDQVLELDILSNRPDTNAIIGIARETAALYSKPFTQPEITLKEEAMGQASDYVTVDIQDATRCPRYIARIVTDVQVGPSPVWMRRRLTMAGIRPINNIVDITNYVMLEYGQPLHAFDIRAVARTGNKHNVVVRTAKEGEKFTTLDGTTRTLTATTLLIADPEKPIGIAGIMGGENSRITDDTKIILFESANFDPCLRLSARALCMRTDASARYEKGLDPNLALISANRAMELIEELGCGKVAAGMVDVYPTPRVERTITFKPNNIKQLLGLDNLSANDICAYLRRVGIETGLSSQLPGASTSEASAPAFGAALSSYVAIIPTHRADITGEADLAEEVGRFYGLNNIPSRYVQMVDGQHVVQGGIKQHSTQNQPEKRDQRENTSLPALPENSHNLGTPTINPPRQLINATKQSAVSLGYYEAKTFPFESAKVFDKLLLPADHPDRTHLAIKNPLGEDMGIMRTLPLNGLLESLARNFNNSNESAYLFELAKTYHPKALPLTELPHEPYFMTLAAYGPDMDFLAIKGDIEEMLASLNVTNSKDYCVEFTRHTLPHTHPGKTALIQAVPASTRKQGRGQNTTPTNPGSPLQIGYLAELHPQVCQNYNLETTAYIAVLNMEALGHIALGRPSFTPPSIFPAMTRDLALVVPETVTSAEVETAIRERGGNLLTEVKLFDVYQGQQITEGHKSMAYALRFRAKDRTLTDKEAEKSMRSIIDNLQKKLGAQVRDK